MIIVMQKKAGAEEVARVVGIIRSRGLTEHISQGSERTVIGAVGDERVFRSNELDNLPGVERVIRILNDWQTISREVQPEDSVIHVRGVAFGGSRMLDITVDEQSAGRADAVYAACARLYGVGYRQRQGAGNGYERQPATPA